MAGETQITVVGNLTADPELRFTSSGTAVANFTVASTPRSYDKQSGQWVDGSPMFLGCSVWRQYAEHVTESLLKGMRVIVTGRLKARSYETRRETTKNEPTPASDHMLDRGRGQARPHDARRPHRR